MAFETCLNYAWSKYLKGNRKTWASHWPCLVCFAGIDRFKGLATIAKTWLGLAGEFYSLKEALKNFKGYLDELIGMQRCNRNKISLF